MATARRNGISRDEMKSELKDAIGGVATSVGEASRELKDELREKFASFERLQTEQFARVNDKLAGDRKLYDEREERTTSRLDDLEREAKTNRWWSGAAAVFGGLLGFGGGKVIH